MIGISKLYLAASEDSDAIRYGRAREARSLASGGAGRKPIVVWNSTRRCNLRCMHCYSASTTEPGDGEMSTDEALAMIEDLGRFGAPVLLFSGGEPLMRPDLHELLPAAREARLRTVLSTNGTLIDEARAEAFADVGVRYVGVSLDGVGATNDKFRGRDGAFDRALTGIRNCLAAGVKVGLRFTVNRHNVADVPAIFDLVEREGIPRVCFYHLVYTGRGDAIRDADLSHPQTRELLDTLIDRTAALHAAGQPVQVLTVDNHADGPYVFLRLLREDPARAERCLELLSANAGNATGEAIACVSWNGDVLPDQFWRQHVVGNVRERAFSEIWTDADHPLLAALRNRKDKLHGRCRTCRWLDVCNGNFRARAEAATGDLWGDDPACYLTDEEIAT